jgi:hypothetical protein
MCVFIVREEKEKGDFSLSLSLKYLYFAIHALSNKRTQHNNPLLFFFLSYLFLLFIHSFIFILVQIIYYPPYTSYVANFDTRLDSTINRPHACSTENRYSALPINSESTTKSFSRYTPETTAPSKYLSIYSQTDRRSGENTPSRISQSAP